MSLIKPVDNLRPRFVVDREAAFWHWAQSLIRWSPTFDRTDYEYYRKLIEPLSPGESSVLELFKNFLQKDDTGFLWLWRKYNNESLKTGADVGEKVRVNFKHKFEAVFQTESRGLKTWAETLNSFNWAGNVSEFLERSSQFFGATQLFGLITVKLCLHAETELPTAHTKKEYPRLIILNASKVAPSSRANVVDVVAHELLHVMLNESAVNSMDDVLRIAYRRSIAPRRIAPVGYHWKHLLMESILTSLASRRPLEDYFGRKYLEHLNQTRFKEVQVADFAINENNVRNQELHIREVALLLLRTTTDYLESGTAIDGVYAETVARHWLAIAQKYKYPIEIKRG